MLQVHDEILRLLSTAIEAIFGKFNMSLTESIRPNLMKLDGRIKLDGLCGGESKIFLSCNGAI